MQITNLQHTLALLQSWLFIMKIYGLCITRLVS